MFPDTCFPPKKSDTCFRTAVSLIFITYPHADYLILNKQNPLDRQNPLNQISPCYCKFLCPRWANWSLSDYFEGTIYLAELFSQVRVGGSNPGCCQKFIIYW